MDNKIEFAQRLKKLREELGYSTKEFAELLGIKLPTYYTYERGQTFPSFDVMISIAQTCDVSLDWLCGVTPVVKFTSKKNDIKTVLSSLLKASEQGNNIEIKISCEGLGDFL